MNVVARFFFFSRRYSLICTAFASCLCLIISTKMWTIVLIDRPSKENWRQDLFENKRECCFSLSYRNNRQQLSLWMEQNSPFGCLIRCCGVFFIYLNYRWKFPTNKIFWIGELNKSLWCCRLNRHDAQTDELIQMDPIRLYSTDILLFEVVFSRAHTTFDVHKNARVLFFNFQQFLAIGQKFEV